MKHDKRDDMENTFISVDEYIGTRVKRRTNKKVKRRKKNKVSKTLGIILATVQVVLTVVFAFSLYLIGIFPIKYLLIAFSIFAILDVLIFSVELMAKTPVFMSKIISVFMSLILFAGSYYMFSAVGLMNNISGNNTKMNKMVVAVLKDNPAETIQDAKDYNFGVQHVIKGHDVRQMIEVINETVGKEIDTTVCDNIQAQAAALKNGNVDAIILNEAYCNVLDDEFGDFTKEVKFIFSHVFTIEMANESGEFDITSDAFSVYISGIDVYGPIETNSRSDVNIMAVVNPKSHQVLLVTTPRDYYVEFPGVTDGELDKLTHAGIYGVDVSMATLDKLYNTKTEFYARVNFTSLIELVDALGGVDVYSEYEFTTGSLKVNKGMNHFNGEQALAFSRERYSLPGGDFQRGKNQQAVITAMIQKAISPTILTKANQLMSTVSENVDTNLTQEQMQSLVKSQLSNPQPWRINSLAAEGTGDKQICYSMPGTPLYVTKPNMDSIESISKTIKMVEEGHTFEE